MSTGDLEPDPYDPDTRPPLAVDVTDSEPSAFAVQLVTISFGDCRFQLVDTEAWALIDEIIYNLQDF